MGDMVCLQKITKMEMGTRLKGRGGGLAMVVLTFYSVVAYCIMVISKMVMAEMMEKNLI